MKSMFWILLLLGGCNVTQVNCVNEKEKVENCLLTAGLLCTAKDKSLCDASLVNYISCKKELPNVCK